jgi:hypothetical protein
MLLAETAVFAELQLIGSVLLVFGGRVIALLACGASKGNDVPHVAKILRALSQWRGRFEVNKFIR